MRFGDVSVTDRTYHEVFVTAYVNAMPAVAAGSAYWIGSFTMPFNGRAVVSLWGKFTWRYHHQQIVFAMSNQSTPAPSGAAQTWILDGIPGPDFISENDIATYATWSSLSAGQTVQMVVDVAVGGGAAQPTFTWACAIVRMSRI